MSGQDHDACHACCDDLGAPAAAYGCTKVHLACRALGRAGATKGARAWVGPSRLGGASYL